MTDRFVARAEFARNRVGALAVYCSDGRWNDQVDEFIEQRLGLPNYDRWVVPGGPAWLVNDFRRLREYPAARDCVSFLVEHHGLGRIILIAHEGCVFYREALACPDAAEALRRQAEELRIASRELRDRFRTVSVEAYVAAVEESRVVFTPIEGWFAG